MRNLGKIPSREVEEALIADGESVDAWDEPINVAASKSPRPDWYRRKEIPIGMTIENCGDDIDAQQLYNFVAESVTGAAAYALRPTGATAASLDFYLVVSSIASVASIADVLWMAYDRFIAPKTPRKSESVAIKIAVFGSDSAIELRLGEEVSKKDFVRGLESIVAQTKQPEFQLAHEKRIRELEESDSWVKLNRKE
jgi:hypothetical protein